MPAYIALLRAVNLGPHNQIKMERLRKSLEALGFEQVQTYIQSGNAVFKTPKCSSVDLCKRIEEVIAADFGLSVPVVVRTSTEMSKVVRNNPFLREPGIDASRLHVTFLSQSPATEALKKMPRKGAGGERVDYCGKEIYLHCPHGLGRAKLPAFEKLLSVQTTTRNWNTVNKLYEMSLQCG